MGWLRVCRDELSCGPADAGIGIQRYREETHGNQVGNFSYIQCWESLCASSLTNPFPDQSRMIFELWFHPSLTSDRVRQYTSKTMLTAITATVILRSWLVPIVVSPSAKVVIAVTWHIACEVTISHTYIQTPRRPRAFRTSNFHERPRIYQGYLHESGQYPYLSTTL